MGAEVTSMSTELVENPAHEAIAALAYSMWQARGCPDGTPDEDWFNAEKALKARVEAWSFYR